MSKLQLDHALQSLFEQGRDPMFITDERGRLSHVNPAFLDLYQYEAVDVMGKSMRVLLQPSLHDVIFYKSLLKRLLQHGTWIGELHIVTRSGEIIPVWTQVLQVNGGFSALQVDLRERDKQSRKMDSLSRLQSVSTLAGGIAHEFNNILGGIQGHLYLFKRGLAANNDKDHDRLTRLDSLVQRATALVQNLLAFSKQKVTSTRDTALFSMLEEVSIMARGVIGKDITLEVSVQDESLIVAVDPVLFKQHIFELIHNAVVSLKRHHLKHEQADAKRIDIRVRVIHEQEVEITIRDNGEGMDAATLQHCLDPFFTTLPVGQGTGLGLSSAMTYIQQLNGTFDIESTLGKSTMIRIHLPLAVTFIEKSEKGGLILLADDDEEQRALLEEVLCYQGYTVLVAEDGAAALALWQESGAKLDAVVMDIVMPNMDGIEVARTMREEDDNLPICLMTGYTYQRIPSRLHVNLMRKPLNVDLLIEYLERTIVSGKGL